VHWRELCGDCPRWQDGDADTISLIDLTAKSARVIATVIVGQTPEGITLSPDGKLCAVVVMNASNKPKDAPFFADQGKLVLLRLDNKTLTRLAKAPIGRWSQEGRLYPGWSVYPGAEHGRKGYRGPQSCR
jgi:YVTN family beta-propeller protein